jgi:2-polyprenyl-3-methyl-5-hydroxy-6-metoxy-1,4-benzoquinol methylase
VVRSTPRERLTVAADVSSGGAKYTYPFDPEARNTTAAIIHGLARQGGRRVLDVGSGPGIVAGALASGAGKDVTCVDFDAAALELARAGGVAATHVVDLRDAKWYAELSGTAYDTVMLADVLEHVVDPERILRDIRREGLVADDGQLVVSIPNANHESVLVELATGHFGYTETGLLDGTHVRFFTLESITALLEATGFGVVEVHRTLKPFGETQHRYRAQELPKVVRAALPSLGLQGRTYQYTLLVRPSTAAARITALTEELELARKAAHVPGIRLGPRSVLRRLTPRRRSRDDGAAAKAPRTTPVLGVTLVLASGDPERTIGYYRPVGFEVSERRDGYLALRGGPVELHFTTGKAGPAADDVLVHVPDVAGLWERLRAGNQPGVGPVEDAAGGLRQFVMTDPDGNRLRVGGRAPAP